MADKEKTELKPCPFCGGVVTIALAEGDEDNGLWDIDCSTKQGQCFIPINNFPFKSKEEAIRAWNNRDDDIVMLKLTAETLGMERDMYKDKVEKLQEEKLKRGKLIEKIGAALNIKYPLENRESIIPAINKLKEGKLNKEKNEDRYNGNVF